MKNLQKLMLLAVVLFSANNSAVQAATFEVTITNLTRGQIFSPPIIATHSHKFSVFTSGEPASPELAALAQDADSVGLVDLLSASSEVHEVIGGTDAIMPGKSVTLKIHSRGHKRFISLVSMLVTTNDAFLGASKLKPPFFHYRDTMVTVPAYDAGAEDNDESCKYIPGPPCGNPHQASDVEGEGYVHIHAGIHGIGDLIAADHDWRNPVARIKVRRVRK